jgi:hypothetical protein
MNNIVNLQNPIPILQQPKSEIITNKLIPNRQKVEEYEIIDNIELRKQQEQKIKLENNGIKYASFATIHTRISESIIGIITEIFDKPYNEGIFEHINNTFTKNQRYAYIGLLLIMISIILYLYRNTRSENI